MVRTTGIEPATPTLGTSCATSCDTSAWSPSPVSSRATRPYQGRADADPKGMSWAPRTRTWKLSVRSRAGPADSSTAHRSRHSVSSRTARLTRAGPQPCAAARVSPARLERALPTSSRSCLLPLGYEDMRADTRCRTGPSAVRRRSRKPCASAWLPGLDSNQQGQGSGPCWDANAPPGIGNAYGRRESNAQAARFELARSNQLPSLPRAPPGNRTPLRGLRARSITTMLAAQRASPGSRTPLASLEDWRIAAMLVRHGAPRRNRTCIPWASTRCSAC